MASLDRIEAGLQSFRVEVRRRPTGPWLRLSGELDLATAPDLEQHLRALEEGEGIRIVLDLSELTFMDSAGLAVILEAERRAGQRHRSLVIRRPSRQATRLLQSAGASLPLS
jgi:anti-sigma B factor antagonist